MSQQLDYIKGIYNRLKELQAMNANFHASATAASRMYPELEIGGALKDARNVDRILAEELEQVKEAHERTKAELEATSSNPYEGSEDSFDRFIADCISDIEDRDDLVADGSTVTLVFHKEGSDGTRHVVLTVNDESSRAEAGEASA